MDPTRGLTSDEVARLVADGRTNAVETATSRSLAEILRANILTRFNAVLGALCVLVIVAGSPADGLFGGLLVVNSLIGIVQEWSAKRKLDRLALLHAPVSRVVREGEVREVHTHDIVLGDVVELRAGDQVPADGTVLTSNDLEVNEANLTGESDAESRVPGQQVMSGTIVTAGSGRFVAESVGAEAYVHRIAAEAKVFTRTRSEIQEVLDRLLRYITWVLVFAAPLQMWSQFRTNDGASWRDAVIRSVGGLVGLVPEGLVLLTTLAFVTAAVKLTREQVLVQELPAVEGLARVSTVCLDKTGTLTTGAILYEGLQVLDGADESLVRSALGALADDPAANSTLLTIASHNPPPVDWRPTGSVPFDSARKWKSASWDGNGSWFLGAPEMLLAPGSPVLARVNDLASTGRRVMVVCRSDQPVSDTLPSDATPVGIVTLQEDVRSDAASTLGYFAEQGVRVVIISGDNPATVGAIARRVGLDVGQPIDARTIGTTAEEIAAHVDGAVVFGRVSPEQKRTIVQVLQSQGEIVAMTGDGVNDALALKKADIGIAMDNGAPATKAVAQLVLLDGQFSHLPNVLAEGRRVIGNVERVANLFLAKNAMSLVAIISAAIISSPFPLLPRHLTLLSSITIGIPAFLLALGPNTKRYERGLLRRIMSFAVPAGAIAGITVVVADFVARNKWGVSDGVKCSISETAKNVVDQECWRVGSGATLAALVVFFAILSVLARPWRAWKIALIATMGGIGVAAFTLPFAREFFNFNLPTMLLLEAGGIGLVGGALIEFVHRLQPSRSVRR
mgnify:FL=1